MRASDVLRLAKDHMVASKLRTALTILGIVMGVMAMTAILSVSEGFGVAIREAMETYFNVRVVFVTSIGTLGTQECKLYISDVEYIETHMSDVVNETFPGLFGAARIQINSTSWTSPQLVMGSSHEKGQKVWPTLYVPLKGEIPRDIEKNKVVLGYKVALLLARLKLKSEDPTELVGKKLTLRVEMPLPRSFLEGTTIASMTIYRYVTVVVKAVLKETGVNLAGFDVDSSVIGTFSAVKEWFKPPEPTSEGFARIEASLENRTTGEVMELEGTELKMLMEATKTDGETLWDKYASWYATEMADYDDLASIIVVYARDVDYVDDIEGRLRKYFDDTGRDQAKIIALKAYARAIEGVLGIFRSLLIVLGIIAVIVASLGVFNTMTTNVRERVKEIGIMKAIGATSGTVLKLFWSEAILMGIIGSFLGVLAGWGAAWVIAATGLLKGIVAFGAVFTVAAEPIMTIEIATSSFAVSLIATAIFGYLPARWASKYDPVVALRYE
ncbi:MAG TPA: ABC transporter permease, partial [Candidatus Bathyarchaeota archaeon]|nr:ABC transporter permease [Candidatus Bathyarchaeota archaeon]